MIQTLVATLIVLAAFFFVLQPLFRKKDKKASSCGTCSSGGCDGCALSDAVKPKSNPEVKGEK